MDERDAPVSIKSLEQENATTRRTLMDYLGLSPERYALGLIRSTWKTLAGLPGCHSRPERISGKTLFVKADNHVQASELKLYTGVILRRIESECNIKLDKIFIT